MVSLGEHEKPVTSMIELDKNILVTASRDGTILYFKKLLIYKFEYLVKYS